jgi:hypothetical protein
MTGSHCAPRHSNLFSAKQAILLFVGSRLQLVIVITRPKTYAWQYQNSSVASGARPPQGDCRLQLLRSAPQPQPRRAPVPATREAKTAGEEELPAFLLPFIEEHVMSIEQASAVATAAAGAEALQRESAWHKVSQRRPVGGEPRKAARLEDAVTLYNNAFRCDV